MAKKTNLQRMQKVLKDIVPALCNCTDYMDVSLHFDDTNEEFIVVSIGSANDFKTNNYKQFWFYSSSTDEDLKTKVEKLKDFVKTNYQNKDKDEKVVGKVV